MAEAATEKLKHVENQAVAKQTEFQAGGIGHQAVSGASAGAAAPPLDGAAVTRIQRNPQNALRSDMLALQRAVGNRAVAALVRGETKDVAIQAKLEVGPVNDAYEQEADHIARLVTSGITQRKPVANAKSKDADGDDDTSLPMPGLNIKRMVQRKRAESHARADGSFTADANVHDRIRRMEGGGRPLPDSVRSEMEPRFGADLGEVRIHTGGEAVQLSRDIGARAFTHGSHIAFGAGNFNPNSQDGRHLLAHELTHTIQQTGAQPLPSLQRSPKLSSVQRNPDGTIQRGVWESVKGFFSKKKTPEPVQISGPIPPGNPAQIQAQAVAKAQKAWDEAGTAMTAALQVADQKLQSHKTVTPEMESAGIGKKREWSDNPSTTDKIVRFFSSERDDPTAKVGVAKKSVVSMQKGDERLGKFTEQFKTSLTELKEKIGVNLASIATNGRNMEHAAPGSARRLALESHGLADEAAGFAEKIKEQAAGFDKDSDTSVAAKRIGLKQDDTRSIAIAEKSASDSVLDLLEIKKKVQNYFLYLDMDYKVLLGYTQEKMESIGNKYNPDAVHRTIGSALERAKSEKDPGMLNDDQAFEVGGITNMTQPEGSEEDSTPRVSSGVDEALRVSLLQRAGQSVAKRTKNPIGIGPTISPTGKDEKKYSKQIKRLEMRAMLLFKAHNRLIQARDHHDSTEKLYMEGHALYTKIDAARKSENHTQEMIDQATRDAGDARLKVAQATVHLEKMRAFKQEVYKESQAYEKYVGTRAMSSSKRKLKKAGGLLGGAGLGILTGGLFRVEAEEEGGGYRVALKGRTIVDDIIRKHYELQQILKGVNGNPVKGLGGPDGVKAYVFFKAVSFALQIIRNISASIALWVTIVTAGTGAPVGAVFASIALYTGIAKAAIDLLLLIWSAAGLANTNDPLSRMILRGENTRQGLAFGEGAFAALGAGLTMGLSGNTGLLTGQKQIGAFGPGSQSQDVINNNWSQNVGGSELYYGGLLRQGANVGISSLTPAVGNIAQNVGVNALSPYVPHATMTTDKHNDQAEKVRKAKVAIRMVANPARTAFLQLIKFAENKKKMSNSKFIAVLPELAKTIEEMGSTVEQTPESSPQSGN